MTYLSRFSCCFYLLLFLALEKGICISKAFAGDQEMRLEKAKTFVSVEGVSFVGFHDPGWLILKNESGENYIGDFYYTFISYDDVKTWTPGEKFLITITHDLGTVIVRKKTNNRYKLFFRQEQNPIDVLMRKCELRYNECLYRALNQWKFESDFAFTHQLDFLKDEKKKRKFIEAQKSWDIYAENLFDSYVAISPYEGGSMIETQNILLNIHLQKSRFYHIAFFYD